MCCVESSTEGTERTARDTEVVPVATTFDLNAFDARRKAIAQLVREVPALKLLLAETVVDLDGDLLPTIFVAHLVG